MCKPIKLTIAQKRKTLACPKCHSKKHLSYESCCGSHQIFCVSCSFRSLVVRPNAVFTEERLSIYYRLPSEAASHAMVFPYVVKGWNTVAKIST